MTLTEFLLARIAEDEAAAQRHQEDASRHGWGDYPARVLAECEAKRIILAELARLADRDLAVNTPAIAAVVKALALPYADHPDYQQEWRP